MNGDYFGKLGGEEIPVIDYVEGRFVRNDNDLENVSGKVASDSCLEFSLI